MFVQHSAVWTLRQKEHGADLVSPIQFYAFFHLIVPLKIPCDILIFMFSKRFKSNFQSKTQIVHERWFKIPFRRKLPTIHRTGHDLFINIGKLWHHILRGSFNSWGELWTPRKEWIFWLSTCKHLITVTVSVCENLLLLDFLFIIYWLLDYLSWCWTSSLNNVLTLDTAERLFSPSFHNLHVFSSGILLPRPELKKIAITPSF